MCFLVLSLAFCLDFSTADSQVPSTPGEAKPAGGKPDYSSEAFVTELDSTRIVFENDGIVPAAAEGDRLAGEHGARLLRPITHGVLTFRYQNSTESADIDYVRVRKQDGSIISTPPENVQDMAADITRAASFYSDVREKHVAVKGLVRRG